jgi:hypothetical protein
MPSCKDPVAVVIVKRIIYPVFILSFYSYFLYFYFLLFLFFFILSLRNKSEKTQIRKETNKKRNKIRTDKNQNTATCVLRGLT